ncbi:hypothetical protein SDC9_61019 [bioreactor metagenome]
MVRYPEVSESWWLTIGICSGLLFVSSNCMESAKHWTFLGIDALNLIVLALLIQLLPPSWGFALNVVVLMAIFLLLYIKSTFYEK